MKILRQPDEKEEKEIREITEKLNKLHLPAAPVCYWQITVSKDGKTLSSYEARSKSWVRNMYNFLAMQTMGLMFGTLGTTYGAGTMPMRDITGATHTGTTVTASTRARGAGIHSQALSGVTANGIVVGTSGIAESFEHHLLGALCAEGTGLNQLNYMTQAAPTAIYDPETRLLRQTLSRVMVNNSAAAITIAEIALRLALYTAGATSGTLAQFMVARDLLVPASVLPIDGTLTANYIVDITYPA